MLTYDEATHSYFWNEEKVPGVNEVIKTLGLSKDWTGTPDFYRQRGIGVALAIQLFLKGTLDESSLDPVLVPYLTQFKGWLTDKPNMGGLLLSEEKYYSKRLRYAGRPDLVINRCIWDVKCTKKFDKDSLWQYKLQGCAYRNLILENFQVELPFKLLQLDGSTAPTKEVDLAGRMDTWDHVIALYNSKTGRV